MAQRALRELGDVADLTITGPKPAPRGSGTPAIVADQTTAPSLPRYAVGDEVATRAAYGAALVALGGFGVRRFSKRSLPEHPPLLVGT
jgi:transketolase